MERARDLTAPFEFVGAAGLQPVVADGRPGRGDAADSCTGMARRFAAFKYTYVATHNNAAPWCKPVRLAEDA